MLKNVIAPVQAWLLSQGKCVACGRILTKPKDNPVSQVVCSCGRIYIYDKESNKFRRATIDEIR